MPPLLPPPPRAALLFAVAAAAQSLHHNGQQDLSPEVVAVLSDMHTPFITDSHGLVTSHECHCRVQEPDFPAACLDRTTPGFAWAIEYSIPRPFCAVDYEYCSYPPPSASARPGDGNVLSSCSPEASFDWFMDGGGLVECIMGDYKWVLGPVGAARTTCAGLLRILPPPRQRDGWVSLYHDECADYEPGSPRKVCAHLGQSCYDANRNTPDDWQCVCPPPQRALQTRKGAASVCVVDECAGNGSVCARAGQACTEASRSPWHLSDWACNCDTSRGLVGSRSLGVAECRMAATRTASAATVGALSAPATFAAAAGDVRCGENEHVRAGRCSRCRYGSVRAGGDRAAAGDTACAALHCSAGEYVFDNTCLPCGMGEGNPAGDSAMGADTKCLKARIKVVRPSTADSEDEEEDMVPVPI